MIDHKSQVTQLFTNGKCHLRRKILAVFAVLVSCGAAADNAAKMRVTFDERNALRGIQVGASTFATGGGDLWTAEFSDGTNRAKRVKACAHEAATCERAETDAAITLVWRDVPLGGEHGVKTKGEEGGRG